MSCFYTVGAAVTETNKKINYCAVNRVNIIISETSEREKETRKKVIRWPDVSKEKTMTATQTTVRFGVQKVSRTSRVLEITLTVNGAIRRRYKNERGKSVCVRTFLRQQLRILEKMHPGGPASPAQSLLFPSLYVLNCYIHLTRRISFGRFYNRPCMVSNSSV